MVLTSQKTATSCIYRGNPSHAGDISIILDSFGNAQAIIQTTKISITPFGKVAADFAHKEGEGDKTLTTWRKIHQTFWKDISPDTLLECEEFKLLHPKLKSE